MSDLIFTLDEPIKQMPCQFCGSTDGVMTFYTGEWENQTTIGRVCIKCIWKALEYVMNKIEEEARLYAKSMIAGGEQSK